MPLYEYLCVECGSSFEYLVRSAGSQEAIVCPKCASTTVNKKFSTFGMKGAAGSSSAASSDACSTGGG
jgi:putative FmdB family regulatory protein